MRFSFFTVPLIVDRSLQLSSRSFARFSIPVYVSSVTRHRYVESESSLRHRIASCGDVQDRQLISFGTAIMREIKIGLSAREPIGRITARQITTERVIRTGTRTRMRTRRTADHDCEELVRAPRTRARNCAAHVRASHAVKFAESPTGADAFRSIIYRRDSFFSFLENYPFARSQINYSEERIEERIEEARS